MAFHGKLILRRSRYPAGFRDVIGGLPHGLILERTPQAVVQHRVDQLPIPELVSLTDSTGQKVGRPTHAFHASGKDEAGVTGTDCLIGEHDRLQPRAADFVDRTGSDRVGQSGCECSLAGGRLADSRGEDLTEDHFIDLRWIRCRPAERLAERHGGQLRSRHATQPTEQLSNRRTATVDEVRGHG